MAIPVVILGTTYNIPEQSESAPWGDELTSLLEALVRVANTSVGSSDILTTTFGILNNQSSPSNVIGLSFDSTQVRSATIDYSLYISTSTNEYSECGKIFITYKSVAGTWELAQYEVGDSGVVFTITNSGQIQYTSTNVTGSAYSGKLVFTAKSFLQT